MNEIPPAVSALVDQFDAMHDDLMGMYTDANLAARRGDLDEAEQQMRELGERVRQMEHHDLVNLYSAAQRAHFLDVLESKWHMAKHHPDEPS